MLRIATALAALAAFPALALGAPRPDLPAQGGPVAKVLSCDIASTERAATFYARMDAIAGATRMQMRFQLLERLGRSDGWDKLDVGALRPWHTSQPGVKRFGWKQTLDGLRAGGAYRVRIQYRWLSASGTVVDSVTRDSPVCRGPLPNIAVGDLSARPGQTAGTWRYRVTIKNTGRVDADEVDVQLSVDRAILDTVTMNLLAAGEARAVSFNGPVCRRGLRVKADPGNSIGESIEDDNSQFFACPG